MRAVRFKYRGKFMNSRSVSEAVRFHLQKTKLSQMEIAKKFKVTPALVSQQKAKLNE